MVKQHNLTSLLVHRETIAKAFPIDLPPLARYDSATQIIWTQRLLLSAKEEHVVSPYEEG